MAVPSSARALPALLARPLPERWLGPFRLLGQLGQGGFAPVWLAEEVYHGKKLRNAAVKLFFLPEGVPPRSARAAAFRGAVLDEARALCRVEHPNVVRFYALHTDDDEGVVGLAMEHIAGESLDMRLRAQGPCDDRAAIEAGAATAWALAAVHGAGLVHRDVKPGNIVRAAAGYKLIDFGIVVEVPEEPTPDWPRSASDSGDAASATWHTSLPSLRQPSLAGTRGYMAPECVQLGAPATPASDLFALGVTLFRLRAGVLPTEAEQDLARCAPGPTAVTGELGALVAKLLDPDPAARPRHAEWVARALAGLRPETAPAAEVRRPVPIHPTDQTTLGTFDAAATIREDTRSPPLTSAPTSEIASDAGEVPGVPRALDPEPPLVGREAALATLARMVAEATDGGVRLALITGPLGVGRTRLLDAAARASGLPEPRVLRLSCSPERRSPLRPLVRALEALPAEAAPALAVVQRAVARALATTGLPAPEGGDGLEGVEDALLRAAAEAPLLVVIDDLQWADAHLCDLLCLLIERAGIGGGRLAILAAARHEAAPPRPLQKLLGRVRGKARPGVCHLPLAPLSEAEAGALARAVLPVDPAVLTAVVRGAGGVPFFVVHAILAWHEEGALVWRDGAFRAARAGLLDEDVPGVAELLEARLAAHFDLAGREGRAAQRVLAAVALHGGGLPAATRIQVVGDDDDVEVAIEALLGAGILVVSGARGEHSFAQEMVRQAALNLLRPRPWFFKLHRALLDALAAGSAGTGDATDAAFLASGYEKLGAAPEARVWLDRAMTAAVAASLFAEAAELGDRLAALAPDPAARAGVELSVVRALIQGRVFDDARARLLRVEASALVSRAGLRPLDLRFRVLRLEAARALREPDVRDPALIADADASGILALRGEARRAVAGLGRDEVALALAGEAVDLAEQCGPAEQLAARLLRVEINAAADRPDLALAQADLERALAVAAGSGADGYRVQIETDLAVIEAERGRVSDAITRLARLAVEAEQLGMRGQLLVVVYSLAIYRLGAGQPTEAAEAAAHAAVIAGRAGDPVMRANALSLEGDARRRAGDLEGALARIDEAAALQRARADVWLPLTLLRRAGSLEALGRAEEMLAEVAAARELAVQNGQKDLALGAALWEQRGRLARGEATRADLERALAEADAAIASGMALRELTRTQMAKARDALAALSPAAAAG